jgi:hypothetical protein
MIPGEQSHRPPKCDEIHDLTQNLDCAALNGTLHYTCHKGAKLEKSTVPLWSKSIAAKRALKSDSERSRALQGDKKFPQRLFRNVSSRGLAIDLLELLCKGVGRQLTHRGTKINCIGHTLHIPFLVAPGLLICSSYVK